MLKNISNNILDLKIPDSFDETQKWDEIGEGIESIIHSSTYMENENSYYFILYIVREINTHFIFKRKKVYCVSD